MKFFTTLILIFVFYPNISHAYIDPGTGSIILQALIAMIAGVSVFFSNIKEKIKKFLKRKKK